MSTIIKLGYFNGQPNFGDLLNVTIAKKVFNIDVEHASYSNCEAVFIGSLLECLTRSRMNLKYVYRKYRNPIVHIWGTGFIAPPKASPLYMVRRIKIHGVRGIFSLNRLRKKLSMPFADVPLGDPGLLSSYLIESSTISKKYRLGIIPHYVDSKSPLLNRINISNSVIIDVCQDPEAVLLQMQQCELIISSAMHGLIAADSLRIPNRRMVLSDNVIGGDYKFNDYYSVFGIDSHPVIDLRRRDFSDADLLELEQSYCITDQQVEDACQGLVQSFPYKEL